MSQVKTNTSKKDVLTELVAQKTSHINNSFTNKDPDVQTLNNDIL